MSERIERGMRAKLGMNADERKDLNERLAKLDDWFVHCKVCGKKRQGTIEQLQQPCACDGK